MRLSRLLVAAPLVLGALLSACASGGGARQLDPRDGALSDVDGAPRALADTWRGHRATVLVWWASTCPCVKRYADRLAALRDRYTAAGVAFAYVSSNADDDLADLAAARAAGREIVPFLKDPGGALAQTLGVISTPTVVVLDDHGAVRFRGWIDNEHVPGDADREPWLEDALDALLAGRTARAVTPVWGCTITRSIRAPGRCAMPTHVAAPGSER